MKFIAPARVAIVAVVGAVALAGCSYVNPIITNKPYAPADGLEAQIGDVHASNLLIVTTAVDEPASLTGSLYNRGGEDVDVSFLVNTAQVEPVTVTVPAQSTVSLALDGDVSVIGNAPAAPGLIAEVAVQSDATGWFTTPVPVVDGTQEEFTGELELLASAEVPAASE